MMRARGTTFFIAACVLLSTAIGGPAQAQTQTQAWSSGTAYTLPQGRIEFGVFQPLRYGLTESIELSSHPLWMFVMPNLSAKMAWTGNERWQVATRHAVRYPTPLLRLLAREGTGGVLPPDWSVPHIIAVDNEVLATLDLRAGHLLTWSLGVSVAPRFGDNQLVTIDLPLVYPRTAAFYTLATGRAGVEIQGPIFEPLSYAFDADVFVLPGMPGNYAFEHSGMVTWRKASNTFRVQVGYKLTYGGYPFGEQLSVLPLVDLVWAF